MSSLIIYSQILLMPKWHKSWNFKRYTPNTNRVFPNSGMGFTRLNLVFLILGIETQIWVIFNNYSIFIFFIYIISQYSIRIEL